MKIGILQAGHVPDALIEETGDYCNLFAEFLDGHGFVFDCYSVVDMQFPTDAGAADGWLITGSRHGVYENHPFIPPLEALTREIYRQEVPLVGICFGHQIIAQALGGSVEKYAGGWSVGATEYRLGEAPVVLNAWHHDQVTTPPDEATVLGSSEFCQYAFLGYGAKAFSVQAHPEFNSTFVKGLIDTRGRGVVPESLLEKATTKLSVENSSTLLAEKIATFFKSPDKAA